MPKTGNTDHSLAPPTCPLLQATSSCYRQPPVVMPLAEVRNVSALPASHSWRSYDQALLTFNPASPIPLPLCDARAVTQRTEPVFRLPDTTMPGPGTSLPPSMQSLQPLTLARLPEKKRLPALPTTAPATKRPMPPRLTLTPHHQQLVRTWHGIASSLSSAPAHMLYSFIGKLGELNRVLSGNPLRNIHARDTTDTTNPPLSAAETEQFCHNVASVMAHMRSILWRHRDPAMTITALFTGLRALVKAGFAQAGDATLVTLQQEYDATMTVLVQCPDDIGDTRMTAVCFNGLREGLAHQVLKQNDKRVRRVAIILLTRTLPVYFSKAQPQDITSALNGLKAILEHQLLQPDDSRVQAAASGLLALISAKGFRNAEPQHIANALNGLKAILRQRVLLHDSKLPAISATTLLTLTAAEGFRAATPQAIANALNGLTAILEYQLLPPDAPQLPAAAAALLGKVTAKTFAAADPQVIANTLNGLKTVLEYQLVKPDDQRLPAAATTLLALTTAKGFRRANPQASANALNGLKAVLEHQILKPDDKRLSAAATALLMRIACWDLEQAKAQEIANALNGLKAVLGHHDLKLDGRQAQAAASGLLALTTAKNFSHTRPQNITNALNGLKTVLDYQLLPPGDPQVREATIVLLAATTATGFSQAAPQAIANALNGLKTVLEYQILAPDAPQLLQATTGLLTLTTATGFAMAEPQHIANALNGLRTVLEYQILKPDDKQLSNVASELLTRLATEDFAQAKAQEIANALYALKTLLECRVLSSASPTVQAATRALLALTTADSFSQADAQAIANTLHALLALLTQRVVTASDRRLGGSVRMQLTLGLTGGLDQAELRQIVFFFRSIAMLNQQYPGLLGESLLREHGKQLLRRASEARQLAQGEVNADKLTRLAGLLQWMMRAGWIDNAQGWERCKTLYDKLDNGERSARQAAILLSAGCRLYGQWFNRQDGHAAQLLERIMREAEQTPWEALRSDELCEIGLGLHRLQDLLRRRKGRRHHSQYVQKISALMQKQAVPALRQALLRRQRPDGYDASNLELLLIQKYLKQPQWLLPSFTPLNQRDGTHLVQSAFCQLAHTPRPMVRGPALRITIVDPCGVQLRDIEGNARQRLLASSLYSTLFDPQQQHAPVLVEVSEFMRTEDLPVFIRHDGHWYRTDLFRGSVNKVRQGQSSYLWGVPVEMASFFSRYWLTSLEGRCYAQRAFLPEDCASTGQSAACSPALSGEFALAAIPDAAPAERFSPSGGWKLLRIQDGCGFIHEDLARQLLGNEQFHQLSPATSQPVRAQGSLPAQALQHYLVSDEECELVAAEFHHHARQHMGTPLEAGADLPCVATLTGAARAGGPATYHATAVPAAGNQLIFADEPGWRNISAAGVILTRAPHATSNLLSISPQDIGYSPELASARAIQYTLTGYAQAQGEEQTPESCFYKGLLVVLPRTAWPQQYANCQIALSAKDLKLCSAFDSPESRHLRQNPAKVERLTLRGCLVVKDVRTGLAAVPYADSVADCPVAQSDRPSMTRLAGDYDGDIVRIAAYADVPTLAALVTRHNRERTGNPKLPKSFTVARDGELDIEKLHELRSGLLQDASVIAERMLSLPGPLRDDLMETLRSGHILGEWYPHSDWLTAAGLQRRTGEFSQLDQAEQTRRLIRCEMELLMKAGTDLEKSRCNFALLWQRLKQYKQVLAPYMSLSLPWGKGVAAKIEKAWVPYQQQGHSPADRQAVEEVLIHALNNTRRFRGLPAMITCKNLSYLLQREAAEDSGAT